MYTANIINAVITNTTIAHIIPTMTPVGLSSDESVVVIPYSGLFLRGKFFTNWPYLMFSRENFHESLRALSAY